MAKNPYRLIELIARGGMAEVYRAENLDIGGPWNQVAVKRFNEALRQDEPLTGSILGELRAAATLRHDNIVDVFDTRWDASGRLCLIMELIDGATLAQLIATIRPPLPVVVHVFRGILCGLAHAHGKGMLHGDVSPQNVLLSRHGHVKLTDFGLAREVNARERSAAFQGKLIYTAPEVAAGDAHDHRADLYSVGVMLYQTLTGQLPFGGETVAECLYNQLTTTPRSLAELRPGLPGSFERLTHGLMASDVQRRYRTATEPLAILTDLPASTHEELGNLVAICPTGPRASEVAPVMPPPRPPPRPAASGSRWRSLATVALIGTLAGGIAGVTTTLGMEWLRPERLPEPLIARSDSSASLLDRGDEERTEAIEKLAPRESRSAWPPPVADAPSKPTRSDSIGPQTGPIAQFSSPPEVTQESSSDASDAAEDLRGINTIIRPAPTRPVPQNPEEPATARPQSATPSVLSQMSLSTQQRMLIKVARGSHEVMINLSSCSNAGICGVAEKVVQVDGQWILRVRIHNGSGRGFHPRAVSLVTRQDGANYADLAEWAILPDGTAVDVIPPGRSATGAVWLLDSAHLPGELMQLVIGEGSRGADWNQSKPKESRSVTITGIQLR